MLDFVSTRRDVLKTGGALFVTFTLAGKVLPALAQGSAFPRRSAARSTCGAVRCRAGAHRAAGPRGHVGPGSAKQRCALHRVRDTMLRYRKLISLNSGAR